MSGYGVNLEQRTLENENYREVLFTGPKSQLVLMCLQPGEEIGAEVHEDHDQFFRVEAGVGKAVVDGEEFELADGLSVVVPAGADHNVLNTSDSEKLKLYTIYSPPEHADGTLHATKADQPAE
jgi:mannose-6-phosphate isomerase-like protein (cupin superfamily)